MLGYAGCIRDLHLLGNQLDHDFTGDFNKFLLVYLFKIMVEVSVGIHALNGPYNLTHHSWNFLLKTSQLKVP
jgi:hypothetical protein